MLRTASFAALAAMVVVVPAHAQTEARPPSNYALENARVVIAPGRVIERGTVVVADGRIVAAGERVAVPATAIRLDLSGMTVYPGLIDAATSVGLPRVTQPGGGRGRGGGPPAPQPTGSTDQGRPTPPPETRPARMAADEFAPSESDLEAVRAAGVTVLGLAFDGGIFPGQTAAVTVGSGEGGELVLRAPVSMQVAFGRKRGAYPGTLMGALAYIKQAFYDAEHDQRVAQAFQRNPAAAPRPSYDVEHRALGPVVAGTLPAWLFASGERELARTIDLARELKLQNYVIVGAQEGYRADKLLAGTGRPVIVSLNFPQPNSVTGRAFELHVAPATGEDTVDTQADSAIARTLRGNAAALSRAGVPIALASHGLSRPADFRDAVLAVVEAGLSPDDALRALTVTPARILGLESALGTIEPGKLANLVVVEGDLFAKTGRIRQVFVEGERFTVREQERTARGGGRGGRGGEEDAVSVAGEWTGSIETPGGTTPFSLTLSMDRAEVTGEFATELGSTTVRGELTGDELVLRGTAAPLGVQASELTVTVRATEDELRGTLLVQGMSEVPFVARPRGRSSELDNQGGEE